jgi:hypothetical protein
MQKALEFRSVRHPRNTPGSSLEVVRLFDDGMGLKGVAMFFFFLQYFHFSTRNIQFQPLRKIFHEKINLIHHISNFKIK